MVIKSHSPHESKAFHAPLLVALRHTTVALGLASTPLCAQPTAAIEEVVVTGRAQQYYLEDTSTTGSKIEMDIIDLPQSVQVLSEQLMIDQAARQITDMYRSIAGISEFSYSGVTARGFRESDNVFYDGVRGDPYAGFSVPQLFNIERVEVLLGPSASLYGGGDPGGMINYVTKKPSFDRGVSLAATGGNYNLYGGSVDANGAVSDKFAVRVGAFYEQQDSFRVNADSKNTQVVSGLLFEPSADSAFTLTAEYIDQDLSGHRLRGVPARDNGSFIVDRTYNTAEAFDYQTLEGYIGQFNVKHRFSDSFSVNSTARYVDSERNQGYHEPRGWVDVNGDGDANEFDQEIARDYRLQERSNEEYSVTVDFVKTFTTSQWQHTLLLGGDYRDIDADFNALAGFGAVSGIPNLNVFNPDYGRAAPATYNLVDFGFSGTEAQVYGVYLQDLVEFNEYWSLMLGLRYDDYEDKDTASRFAYADDNTSSRAGLVFKPTADAAFYLNYSESFTPISLADQQDPDASGTLDPETGTQWEVGWKRNWLEGALRTTLALYTINKNDVPQFNPQDGGPNDGIPALINFGEVESEGVELAVIGDITDRWTVTGNYAYNNVDIIEGSSIPNSLGGDFANAPEHQAGLWSRYALFDIDSSIAVGLDYVSDRSNLSGQQVKAYTVYDASWTTTLGNLQLQVNVRNIFDKEYFVSGFSERAGNFPGAPREFVFQARYSL